MVAKTRQYQRARAARENLARQIQETRAAQDAAFSRPDSDSLRIAAEDAHEALIQARDTLEAAEAFIDATKLPHNRKPNERGETPEEMLIRHLKEKCERAEALRLARGGAPYVPPKQHAAPPDPRFRLVDPDDAVAASNARRAQEAEKEADRAARKAIQMEKARARSKAQYARKLAAKEAA
jgi:hypothetical protein